MQLDAHKKKFLKILKWRVLVNTMICTFKAIYYCELLYLTIFGIFVWNIWVWLVCFFTVPRLAWEAAFKKTKINLEPLTDIDMLLMVENGIRGGICHVIYRYTKATKNECMKDYDKNKESSYLKYWNVNNLYRWAIPKMLPVNGFKWVERIGYFDKLIDLG